MPSPFPGMDPYLENPSRWPGLHTHLVVQLQAQLNALIAPRYIAMIEERVYVSDPLDAGRHALVPDLHLRPHLGSSTAQVADDTMLAVVEPIEVELADDEIHDTYISILTADQQRVVAVLEVLSPTNKVHHSRGQELFLRKRQEVFHSTAHWIELDLLRDGERSAPAEVQSQGDYFVYVASHTPQRRRHRVWPIKLPQHLPRFAVPLLDEQAVSLDLQESISAVYERGAYERIVDYRHEPMPPLPPAYQAWSQTLLAEKGLR